MHSELKNVRFVIYFTEGCPMANAIHKRLEGEPKAKNFYFQDFRDLSERAPTWLKTTPTLVDIANSLFCEGIECLFFVEEELKQKIAEPAMSEDFLEQETDLPEQLQSEISPISDRKSERLNEEDLLAKIRSRFQ